MNECKTPVVVSDNTKQLLEYMHPSFFFFSVPQKKFLLLVAFFVFKILTTVWICITSWLHTRLLSVHRTTLWMMHSLISRPIHQHLPSKAQCKLSPLGALHAKETKSCFPWINKALHDCKTWKNINTILKSVLGLSILEIVFMCSVNLAYINIQDLNISGTKKNLKCLQYEKSQVGNRFVSIASFKTQEGKLLLLKVVCPPKIKMDKLWVDRKVKNKCNKLSPLCALT